MAVGDRSGFTGLSVWLIGMKFMDVCNFAAPIFRRSRSSAERFCGVPFPKGVSFRIVSRGKRSPTWQGKA
jgi:hypothetical protein